ncbi:hypothetical protein AB0I00_13740 [Streptomyces sp. NPDC050803]|uniref:hypothetical protein n=1 Tax=unclassified Streptomyces TaxID=2593676 RepID=UPI00344398EB
MEPLAVQVGVRLPREPEAMGEWLADAASFDAAGADALWVDGGPRWDVLALTAALAVTTYRSLLVVALPDTRSAELSRTLDTLERLSQGRLALLADGPRAVVPTRTRVFRRLPDGVVEAEVGRWVPVPAPEGRAAWRDTCAGAAESGVRGVVVPAGPLLLDLLRNPEDPTGRGDLHLAQG